MLRDEIVGLVNDADTTGHRWLTGLLSVLVGDALMGEVLVGEVLVGEVLVGEGDGDDETGDDFDLLTNVGEDRYIGGGDGHNVVVVVVVLVIGLDGLCNDLVVLLVGE